MKVGELTMAETVPAVMAGAGLEAAGPAGATAPHPMAFDRRRGDRLASWLMRTGLAFVFLYAAMSSFLHPATFAGYFPSFLPESWATELLPVFGVYEVLLAVALCTRRLYRVAAVVAALTLGAITASNPDTFNVLFRNVAIACAALALAAQTPPEPAAAGRPPRVARAERGSRTRRPGALP